MSSTAIADDEVMEIREEDPLGAGETGSGLEDDLDLEEEEVVSDDEEGEGEKIINSTFMSSSIHNPTSELDNSIDLDSSVEEVADNSREDSCDEVIEDDDESLNNPIVLNGGTQSRIKLTSTSTPNNNTDDIMEIPEEDPLGAEIEGGSGLEDDLDEEEILSDDEEGLHNLSSINSPTQNTTVDLDNSLDSSIEELGETSGGLSCEEVLDDEDEEDEEEESLNRPIVVNDTKSLAQLAATSTASSNNNNSTIININTPATAKKEQAKEPTLVIIDTNSILSGKGPIPIQKPTITSTVSLNNTHSQSSSPTTPKPIAPKSDILLATSKGGASIDIPDDAFLIEAPSFIVPYVFEQTGEKVLKTFVKGIAEEIKKEKAAANGDADVEELPAPKKKSEDYFESPVGKLLINLGMSLVQEYVQVDLLKLQRRKAEKERTKSRSGVPNIQTQQSIISLKNNIEESKENNEPFRFPLQKCKNCNFKTESELVLSTHLETPHMKNNCYRCNFCKHTTKLPHEILLHMELDHKIRPRLERQVGIHFLSLFD